MQYVSLVTSAQPAEPGQILFHFWSGHGDSVVCTPAAAGYCSTRSQPGLQGQRDSIPDFLFLISVPGVRHLQR